MHCFIKENSFIAKLAAKKLHAVSVAIVIGKTIHLHNARQADLINNPSWLRHEIMHIKQFREHGFLLFLIKYLWESLINGYYNNKYEKEARAAESNESICDGITFEKR